MITPMAGYALTQHMAQHALTMNILAPLLVISCGLRQASGWGLAAATAMQVVLFVFWHAPPVMAGSGLGHDIAMHISLLSAACLFWASICGSPVRETWRPMAALLMTGKVFCLLGAVLIFAPRNLYAFHCGYGPGLLVPGLEDQQMAGLLMVAICPLAYVGTAVALFWRWFEGSSRTDQTSSDLKAVGPWAA